MTPVTHDGPPTIGADEFRDIIGHFASGVTVITTVHDGVDHGTTASAVSSLSLEPPMLLVCLNHSSDTGRAIAAAGIFAVNVIAADRPDDALRFARKGPGKFDGLPTLRGAYGEPLLEHALATLECRVVEQVTGGTHAVFLAEVDHAVAGPGAPLAYFRGAFGRLEAADDTTAYRELHRQTLDRTLPVGVPLDLDALTAALGVPRGAVYHALARLRDEQLVTRTTGGAFAVTPLTLAVAEESIRARCAMTLGAAALTVGAVDAAAVASLRALLPATRPPTDPTAFDLPRSVAAYAAFHDRLIRLVDSAPLLEAYRTSATAEIIVHLTALGAGAVRADREAALDAFASHTLLVRAYEAGDATAAAATIRRHFEHALTYTRRFVASAGGAV